MQTCLDHAGEALKTETPKELVQQLASASQALQRARGSARGPAAGADTELDQLRALLDPAGGA
jgi:hypothetical protein